MPGWKQAQRATADVTFTDGSSNTVVMHVTGNGAGSADLTGLADGPITVSIEATDTAGNTASGSGDTLKRSTPRRMWAPTSRFRLANRIGSTTASS